MKTIPASPQLHRRQLQSFLHTPPENAETVDQVNDFLYRPIHDAQGNAVPEMVADYINSHAGNETSLGAEEELGWGVPVKTIFREHGKLVVAGLVHASNGQVGVTIASQKKPWLPGSAPQNRMVRFAVSEENTQENCFQDDNEIITPYQYSESGRERFALMGDQPVYEQQRPTGKRGIQYAAALARQESSVSQRYLKTTQTLIKLLLR